MNRLKRFGLFFLFSCSSLIKGYSQTKGVFFDSLSCRHDQQQRYALYLPSHYDSVTACPLLLFFDPGGRATVPLMQYKDLADQYNIVIACPYNAKNGPMDISVAAAYAVLKDIATNYKFDNKNIWVSGFSGGARLASLLALQDSQFKNVIACGATFPANMKVTRARKVPYVTIIGNRDMNYLEARQTEKYLFALQNPNTLIIYPGEHTWPPVTAFNEAIQWTMIENKLLNEDEEKKYFQGQWQQAILQRDSGFLINANRKLDVIIQQSRSEKAKSSADSLKKVILNDAKYASQTKNDEKLLATEEQWRNKFLLKYDDVMRTAQADSSFVESEWLPYRKEISKFREAKDHDKQLMGDRLFDFAWRACAERGGQMYEMQAYDHALRAAQIWSAMAPKDSRSYIAQARIYALKGSNKEALKNIKTALEKGFSNKNFLIHDAAFKSLQGHSTFQKLLNQE